MQLLSLSSFISVFTNPVWSWKLIIILQLCGCFTAENCRGDSMNLSMESCEGVMEKGPVVCITFSPGKLPMARSQKMESASPSDNSCPRWMGRLFRIRWHLAFWLDESEEQSGPSASKTCRQCEWCIKWGRDSLHFLAPRGDLTLKLHNNQIWVCLF